MKKIIPIVLIALILAAAAAYGNSKDYYMWNATNKYLKRERCLWMIDGYLGAAETLKMLRTSPPRAKTAEEYLLEQIPDLHIEDYAKMIVCQIELFYAQGKFREALFPTIFAAAVVEIAKEGKE